MPTDAERFLGHLQDVFGKEDAIHSAEASDGLPPVSAFVYRNIPEAGMITGVTYGLSLCSLPAWKLARPEMIISVKSESIDWPLAAATFAAAFRGKKAFSYGDVFTTDLPLADDSKMDGFLIFAQSILDSAVETVQLANYKIHFSQFYPIYKSEVGVYESIGLKVFWHHKHFDMYDIQRRRIKA